MRIVKFTAGIAVAMLVSSATVLMAAGALHTTAEPTSLGPIQAGSYRLGATHVVAYYLPQDGTCAVTAAIEEAVSEDEPSLSSARVRFDLAPGTRAFIDNAEGRSVALECGAGAETLLVERQDIVAEFSN